MTAGAIERAPQKTPLQPQTRDGQPRSWRQRAGFEKLQRQFAYYVATRRPHTGVVRVADGGVGRGPGVRPTNRALHLNLQVQESQLAGGFADGGLQAHAAASV